METKTETETETEMEMEMKMKRRRAREGKEIAPVKDPQNASRQLTNVTVVRFVLKKR
jgi:hypothetical protein